MKPVQFLSLAVPVALGLAIAAPGSASATPADGVNGIVMSQATLNGKDYISREITAIASGRTTGWHYHPGQVFGVIHQH